VKNDLVFGEKLSTTQKLGIYRSEKRGVRRAGPMTLGREEKEKEAVEPGRGGKIYNPATNKERAERD